MPVVLYPPAQIAPLVAAIARTSASRGWPHRLTLGRHDGGIPAESDSIAASVAHSEHIRTGVNVYDAHCWTPWRGEMGATVVRWRKVRDTPGSPVHKEPKTIRLNIRCHITVAQSNRAYNLGVATWEDGSVVYFVNRQTVPVESLF